jgi:hypothetical protein
MWGGGGVVCVRERVVRGESLFSNHSSATILSLKSLPIAISRVNLHTGQGSWVYWRGDSVQLPNSVQLPRTNGSASDLDGLMNHFSGGRDLHFAHSLSFSDVDDPEAIDCASGRSRDMMREERERYD